MFEAMDANHDGKVTAAEREAAHEKVTGRKSQPGEKTAAEKIRAIDKNRDGIASAGEHETASKRMFDVMDTNHDGFLSEAELNAGHAGLKKK
jgi:Ca2+-binding EF-hand superfamily protein